MDIIKLTSMKDVFRACCHIEDGQKFPETVLTISKGYFEEGKKIALSSCTSFMNFIPAFYCHEDTLEVDIKFRNRLDANLTRTLQLYHQYRDEAGKYYANAGENVPYPSIQMMLVPMVTKGRYQLIMSDPELFILCATNPNEYPTTIKFVFHQENVLVMESDNVDYAQIAAEVKRKEEMEAFYEMEEEKKRKRDAFEAERAIRNNQGGPA